MSVWDKVKEGMDKANKAAHDVFDEGKTRIDAYRARELADKAAEAFGYAVFRAGETGKDIDADSRDRLIRSLRERDAEAHRLEAILAAEAPLTAAPAAPAAPSAASAEPAAPMPEPPTHV